MAEKDLKNVFPDLDTIIEKSKLIVAAMQGVNTEYEKFGDKIVETSKKVTESQKKASGANKEEQEQLEDNAKAAEKLIKAQEAYRKSLSENEQEIRNIKKTQQELIKQKNLEIKVNQSAEGSYDQLSAKYALAKRRLNAMSAEERSATQTGRELVAQAAETRAEMSRLQRETGNHTLEVGNYENANNSLIESMNSMPGPLAEVGGGISGLKDKFKAFFANPYVAIFAAIAGAVIAVGKALSSTRDGSKMFAKGMNTITSSLDVAKSRFREFSTELTNTFKEGEEGVIKGFVKNSQKDFKRFVDNWKEAGFKGAFEKEIDITKKANTLFKEGTSNFVDQVKAVKALKDELVNMQDSLIDSEQELAVLISEQQFLSELQTSIADDATKSFLERENAAEKARKATESASANEIKLAKERLAIEDQNIRIAEELGQIDAATGRAITKSAIEVKQARLEAYLELREAEQDYTLTIAENEKLRSELVSDRLEKDLDIQIDGFDNQKTINERIIADDKQTLATRFNLLAETEKLNETSFNKQIETIETFAKRQIDMNDLIQTSDAVVLNEKIRALGLSEIWEGRLLEAIRERRIATQDLAEAESDLNEKAFNERLESFDKQKELDQLRLKNAGATSKEINDLEIKATIERYKKELELAKVYGQELSDVEVSIIQEKIISLQNEVDGVEPDKKFNIWDKMGFSEEEAEKTKDNLKQATEAIKEVLTTFADQRIEQSDRVVEAANNQVSSAESNLAAQIQLANDGYAANVQNAQQQLTLQKQTQKKALAEQAAALKAKERLDTAEQLVSLITASANILKGWSTVPFVGQVLGIAAIAAMFASFAITKTKAKKASTFATGGYEEIGGGTHASGNDTVIGYSNDTELRAEKGESIGIFTGKARKKYGSALPKIVEDANKLKLEDRFNNSFSVDYAPINNNDYGYDSHELKEIKEVLKRMESQGNNEQYRDKKNRRVTTQGNITRIID